jgi:prepilin-type N-terminal cleavage/methylation domain-containing protein
MMRSKKTNQEGFTYIELMIAIIILTIGILAQLSALSLSMLRASETEQRNEARQIASSTLESIFSARDLGNANGINNWEAINLSDVNSNGIFKSGWNPIREDAGQDGIHGTADDACTYYVNCVVGSYINTSEVNYGFERKIEITDIAETGFSSVRKRRIEVKIRYGVGQIIREETLSTLIADLPFNK